MLSIFLVMHITLLVFIILLGSEGTALRDQFKSKNEVIPEVIMKINGVTIETKNVKLNEINNVIRTGEYNFFNGELINTSCHANYRGQEELELTLQNLTTILKETTVPYKTHNYKVNRDNLLVTGASVQTLKCLARERKPNNRTESKLMDTISKNVFLTNFKPAKLIISINDKEQHEIDNNVIFKHEGNISIIASCSSDAGNDLAKWNETKLTNTKFDSAFIGTSNLIYKTLSSGDNGTFIDCIAARRISPDYDYIYKRLKFYLHKKEEAMTAKPGLDTITIIPAKKTFTKGNKDSNTTEGKENEKSRETNNPTANSEKAHRDAKMYDEAVCVDGENICISGYNKTSLKKINSTTYEYHYEEEENLNLTCTQNRIVRYYINWKRDGKDITTQEKRLKQWIQIELPKNKENRTYTCRAFEDEYFNPYNRSISIIFHHIERNNMEENSGKHNIPTQKPRIKDGESEAVSDWKWIIIGTIAFLVLIVIILPLTMLIWKNIKKPSEVQMKQASKFEDAAPQNTYTSEQQANYTNSGTDKRRLLESSENITREPISQPYPDVCDVYAEPAVVSSNYEVYCDPYSAMYTTPVPKKLRIPGIKNGNKSPANSTLNKSQTDYYTSPKLSTLVKKRDIDYATPAYTSLERESDGNYTTVGYNTIEKKADRDYTSPVYSSVEKKPKVPDKSVTYTNIDKKLKQIDSSANYTNLNNKSSCANVKKKGAVTYNVDSDSIYSS